jgi:hypothetical protein
MDERYRLLGPDKLLYIITLSGHCTSCDAPPGISIEEIDETHSLYREYQDGEFNCEPLVFEKWADSMGVAIITGMRQHEFVKAMSQHLVGVSSDEMGEDGTIDADGAEVIAEEMYNDSQSRPTILRAPSHPDEPQHDGGLR